MVGIDLLIIISCLCAQWPAGAMMPREDEQREVVVREEGAEQYDDAAAQSWWRQFLRWLDKGCESTTMLWNPYGHRGVPVCNICKYYEVGEQPICGACREKIEQRRQEYDELDQWLVGRF